MVKKKNGKQSLTASVWPAFMGWAIGTVIWSGLIYLFLHWLSGVMVGSDTSIVRGLGVLVAFFSVFTPYFISYKVGRESCLGEIYRQRSEGSVPLLSTGWSTFSMLIYILWIPVLIFAVLSGVSAYKNINSDSTSSQAAIKSSFIQYSGDGFSASFPEKPKVDNADGGTRYSAIGDGSYTYSVEVQSIPSGYDNNTIFHQASNQPDYKVISQNYGESVLGHPAASAVVSTQTKDGETVEYHNKFIIKDNELYMLSVYGFSHDNLEKYLNDFVDSLTLE